MDCIVMILKLFDLITTELNFKTNTIFFFLLFKITNKI